MKAHGDQDEDSDYDDPHRAVPDVSMEELHRDPVAAWRKFKRHAERPGHISSHRSAYRRLPQYLRLQALDRFGQQMRIMQWQEEEEEDSLWRLQLEHREAFEEKVGAWLHSVGEMPQAAIAREGEAEELTPPPPDPAAVPAPAPRGRDALPPSGDRPRPGTAVERGGWGEESDVDMLGVQLCSGGAVAADAGGVGAAAADVGQDEEVEEDSDMRKLKEITDGIAASVGRGLGFRV
jgi:hypothetical protein